MTGPRDIPRYNCFEGELNKETGKFVWFKDYRELKSAADKLAEALEHIMGKDQASNGDHNELGIIAKYALKDYRGEM